MKKFIAFVAILLATTLVSAPLYAQSEKKDKQTEKAEKKAAKEREKAEKKAAKEREKAEKERLAFEQAPRCIQERKFVVEASRLIFDKGKSSYVSATTNFVMINVDEGSVQVASNKAFAGPNGIGGITVDGRITDYRLSVTKKGIIQCRMNVMGSGISAQLTLTVPKGSNKASVRIIPNFKKQDLTLEGELVPLRQSSIFKGRSF